MAVDITDVALELNDDNEQHVFRSTYQHTFSTSSVETLENYPSPPAPFHRVVKRIHSNETPVVIEPSPPAPVSIDGDQEDEWARVPNYVIGEERSFPLIDGQISTIVPFDNIFFSDAKTYLFGTTIEPVQETTNENSKRKTSGFFRRFFHFFHINDASSMIDEEFNRQCQQLLNLTSHPYEMSDRMHTRILYTIYRRLTNSKQIFYASQGPHWEEIGFQTSNPETDFRSTGLFSLLLLLYFVDSMYLPLAKQIYTLSHDPEQQFPFSLIGINLANSLIKLIRHPGHRNTVKKLIIETRGKKSEPFPSDAVVVQLGNLFIALYLSFYVEWKEKSLSIQYTHQVLSTLERTLIERPKFLLKQFNEYFQRPTTTKTNISSGRAQQYELHHDDNLI